jgi:hypothetical protein
MDRDSQYYVLEPGSIQVRIITRQRRVMYRRFVELLDVGPQTTIIDIGVTSDRTFENSNYLEAWHPHPGRIMAVGLDDASFLCSECAARSVRPCPSGHSWRAAAPHPSGVYHSSCAANSERTSEAARSSAIALAIPSVALSLSASLLISWEYRGEPRGKR